MRKFHFWLSTLVIMSVTGCGSLMDLAKDLKFLDDESTPYSLSVTGSSGRGIVLVEHLNNADSTLINGYDVMIGGQNISILTAQSTQALLVFEDSNNDLMFQPNEKFSMVELRLFSSDEVINVEIGLKKTNVPEQLVNKPLKKLLNIKIVLSETGKVVSLSDKRFSKESAKMGMWQPIRFFMARNTGLYFLTPYDANKIPVVFVHGMDSTALDFKPLIDKLDNSKYQAWVLNYPSAVSLPLISKGLANMIHKEMVENKVKNIHIVAHSMGGLVVEDYLNQCAEGNNCQNILSFTSISSPFSGVASAKSGVEYSPVVMPAWRDLNPESEFIRTLFNERSNKPPHLLLFGYDGKGAINVESNDGVIDLSSQLRQEAQQQATKVMGFNEGHVSILSSDTIYQEIEAFWQSYEH